jgi:hypothetical protein
MAIMSPQSFTSHINTTIGKPNWDDDMVYENRFQNTTMFVADAAGIERSAKILLISWGILQAIKPSACSTSDSKQFPLRYTHRLIGTS